MADARKHTSFVRSSLAVPGSNPHMMEKSLSAGADEVFFDLEDAVAPNMKVQARTMVADALRRWAPFNHVQAVRINAVGSGLAYRDVIEVVEAAGNNLDRLIVPKVDNASDIVFLDGLLSEIELALGLEMPVELEVLIESAAGAVNIGEIVNSSARVTVLIFGAGDYTADIGIERPTVFGDDVDSTHWARSGVVNHAVASGALPIDGPYPGLRDEEGFRAASVAARRLGFRGKWCVHPAQVPWCNQAFGVDEQEVSDAQRILDEYEKATTEGVGAIAIDGRLVDEATRKHAERIVAAARLQETEVNK
jgi:citrate lyase subunit beta/citryl-CoA lyase